MNVWCSSDKCCPYKTDMGNCGYTGMVCPIESTGNSIVAIKIPQESEYKIVRAVDISDECIEKIADVLAKKLSDVLRLRE